MMRDPAHEVNEPAAEKPTAFFGDWRDEVLFDSIGEALRMKAAELREDYSRQITELRRAPAERSCCKRLELLREVVPNLRRLAVVDNVGNFIQRAGDGLDSGGSPHGRP
jgi:hypothetical protein